MRLINNTIFILFIFVSLNPAFAQDASITDIVVSNTRDNLLIYLKLKTENTIREKMEKAVISGVPVTFSYIITLNRVRDLWFDDSIAKIDISHTIRYNNIKKEYIVKRSWENGEPNVVKSFAEAGRLMAEIDSLKITPLKTLEKGSRYQISAKAELIEQTLPFYLHYVLFFISRWDFETDWHTIDFIY